LRSSYICIMKTRAIVIGASGLIGSLVVEKLLESNYQEIKLLVRKPLTFKDSRINQKIVDFSNFESYCAEFEGFESVFCAIGTTRKKTPDLNDYRKIDYDIPVNAIRCSEKNNVQSFMLVSSVGANPESSNFYLKIKGEVEQILQNAPIANKAIFQPSLLIGERKEKRFGEWLAQKIMPVFNFIMPSAYKAIPAEIVAKAMVDFAQNKENSAPESVVILQYAQMIAVEKKIKA